VELVEQHAGEIHETLTCQIAISDGVKVAWIRVTYTWLNDLAKSERFANEITHLVMEVLVRPFIGQFGPRAVASLIVSRSFFRYTFCSHLMPPQG
jgi:hypothetical protein